MTSLPKYKITNSANLDTYGFIYKNKLYYYDDGVKERTEYLANSVIKSIPIQNSSAFTVVDYKLHTYLISTSIYFSSNHYFDTIINRLVVIDCDTNEHVNVNQFNNANNNYVKKITCTNSIITLYDTSKYIICQLSIYSLLANDIKP